METSLVKVSVIIPVYNEGPWITRCLDSIAAQTLREIEILCVDDGSTDNSLQVLNEYAQKEPRLTVRTQQNGGSASARNHALSIARGEFVAFIDADDCYDADDVLETLYTLAKAHGARICGGNLRVLLPQGEKIQELIFEKEGMIPYRDVQMDYGFNRYIFQLQMLREADIRFPDYLRGQDPPFLVYAMHAAGSFYVTPKVITVYDCSQGDIQFTERQLLDIVRQRTDLLRFTREHGYSRLHYTIASRFRRYPHFAKESVALRSRAISLALLRANEAVDVAMLRQEDAEIDEDFILYPLDQILRRATDYLAIKRRYTRVTTSSSYRIGRALTWPLRKARSALRRLKGRSPETDG